MGPQQPALLLRRALNVERAPEVRRERLSSGTYELASVRCRLCHTELGWRYLSAASQARPPLDVFATSSKGRLPGSLFRVLQTSDSGRRRVRAGVRAQPLLPCQLG